METRRVLGIDPGEARVGVALSDELGMLAHPLETIEVAKLDPCGRIAELVSEACCSRHRRRHASQHG